MADDVDIASVLAEMHLERSLAKHAAREKNEEISFYCVECDEVIPHRRRAAIRGVKTCVDCQSVLEKQKY